jgi:transcriptional regulator of nitric oxide reductase
MHSAPLFTTNYLNYNISNYVHCQTFPPKKYLRVLNKAHQARSRHWKSEKSTSYSVIPLEAISWDVVWLINQRDLQCTVLEKTSHEYCIIGHLQFFAWSLNRNASKLFLSGTLKQFHKFHRFLNVYSTMI